jgi:uncharacterized membrane protein
MPASFRLFLAIMVVIGSLMIGSFAGTNIAAAQSPEPGTAVKKSMNESAAGRRNAAEEKERLRQERAKAMEQKDYETMEARKRKRTECGKQAKQQGLHLLKRRGFIKKCMAG